MTAAGNDEQPPAQGNERGGLNLAEDPDISMMFSPAVYPSNLAVASINSTINMQSVLSWTDAQGQSHTVPFSDPNEVAMKRKFPESQSFVVYDAGYGTYMDYYNAGFSNGYNGGKTGIALSSAAAQTAAPSPSPTRSTMPAASPAPTTWARATACWLCWFMTATPPPPRLST